MSHKSPPVPGRERESNERTKIEAGSSSMRDGAGLNAIKVVFYRGPFSSFYERPSSFRNLFQRSGNFWRGQGLLVINGSEY